MGSICYRCSGALDAAATYCPECGAPQVRYVPQETEDVPSAISSGTRARHQIVEDGGPIHWKLAIRIAVIVATAVGVLSAVLAAGSVLWVAVGAVVVVGMYRRRRPQALLNSRIGARIGVLVGMIAASVALAGNAVLLLVQRFALHQGNQIDVQLSTIVKQAAEHATSMDPEAPVAMFMNFWLSAEGKIGLILLTMAFLSVLILLFAVAGGVLGAQVYRSPRNRKMVS
jgi:ribosomal protein L40E